MGRTAGSAFEGGQTNLLVPLPTGPIVEVLIDDLELCFGVRSQGVDLKHAEALAELDCGLPPIVVDGTRRLVIDGRHRLKAAQLNGRKVIKAVSFDGPTEKAFILAVQANSRHGLPLTMDDRRAAAGRIVKSHPELSDRAIARTAGLSAKVVKAIRCSTADSPQSNSRVGHDGRWRPLDPAAGRLAAVNVLEEKPTASLREVAREAGVSVSTARDVRERLKAGEDPVPPSQRGGDDLDVRRSADAEPPMGKVFAMADARSTLNTLRHDPRLRYTESGRQLLRWLAPRVLGPEEWLGVLDGVAPHNTVLVARLAHECSAAWAQLADELDVDGGKAAYQQGAVDGYPQPG